MVRAASQRMGNCRERAGCRQGSTDDTRKKKKQKKKSIKNTRPLRAARPHFAAPRPLFQNGPRPAHGL